MRSGIAAAAVVLAGLVLRLLEARGVYLNGDEALHFHIFNQPGAAEVYRLSLTNAHPPLYFLVLYAWQLLGGSELFLRLPAVVFGSLFLWQAWRWAMLAFDGATAFVALSLLAFSPSLIALCAEVRGYGVFLFCLASSWLFLEKALRQGRVRDLVLFATFQVFSILLHYSALWATAAAAVYALLRLRGHRGRFVLGLGATQLLAAGLYGWLWFVHLRHLRGGAMEQGTIDGWLRSCYFHPGLESALAWVPARFFDFFRWLLPWEAWRDAPVLDSVFDSAKLLGVPFLVGVAFLIARRRPAAVLLLGPFVLGAVAGVLSLYPFGGSRHSAWLALPAAAGAALVAALPFRGRRAVGALLCLLGPAALVLRGQDGTLRTFLREAQAQRHMDAAVAELGRAAPRDQLLFLDQQAFVTATYYLDREQVAPGRLTPEGLIEARLDGRRTIGVLTWRFDGLAFVRDLARVRDALRLPAGTPVWVLALGVECDLGGELGAAGFVLPHLARFGPSVSLLQVRLR